MSNVVSAPVPITESSETDVVIIGGGIAGLYCARILAERGRRVEVLETRERFGGRIETEVLQGPAGEPFLAEFGPMRFEIKLQPLFEELCKRYGVDFHPFPPPTPADWTVDFSLPPELCDPEADPDLKRGKELNPFELLRLGVFRMLGLQCEIKKGGKVALVGDDTDWLSRLNSTEAFEALRREAKHPDGRYLYDLGFFEAMEIAIGHPAVKKIMSESTFYDLIGRNPNAIEWAIFWLRYFQLEEGEDIQTIRDGVDTIVTRIVEEIEQHDSVTLRLSTTALTVLPDGDRVLVEAETAAGDRLSLRAADVIFALPQWPLGQLGMEFPVDVQTALTKVVPIHLTKVFAVTKTPPWWKTARPQPQQFAHRVPSREVHYLEHGTDTVVLIYTDEPETRLWSGYVRASDHRAAEINAYDELKTQLSRVIRDVHVQWATQTLQQRTDRDMPIEELSVRDPRAAIAIAAINALLEERRRSGEGGDYDILGGEELPNEDYAFAIYADIGNDQWVRKMVWESIGDYGIRDWSREPFGAGVHLWAPGAKSWEVRERFAAFSFAGFDRLNLHICGEAYSEYQGFIEGALSSAEVALATMT